MIEKLYWLKKMIYEPIQTQLQKNSIVGGKMCQNAQSIFRNSFLIGTMLLVAVTWTEREGWHIDAQLQKNEGEWAMMQC